MDKVKWGKFWLGVQFDLEGQGQMSHKTIGISTKLFCTSGPNLVILAWTGDELSRRQAHDYRTYRHTQPDAGNDNTRRPKLASGKKHKKMIKHTGDYNFKDSTIFMQDFFIFCYVEIFFPMINQ